MLAVMCGIFSAGMSFAMNAAKPMHDAAQRWALTRCIPRCPAMW
jgi:L-rhamnose-H+ transport protein